MSVVIISGPCTIIVTSAWTPPATISLADGGSFDLKPTLPPEYPVGGTFGVDPGGPALASGVTLDPTTGILSDAPGGAGSSVTGVKFTYSYG